MSIIRRLARRGLACVTLAALALGGAAGCATTGVERTESAVTSLRALRDEIQLGRGKILDVTHALDRVLNAKPEEVRQTYEAYCITLVDFESAAQHVRERVQSMTSRAAEYQKVWDDEIKAIGDPDLRNRADERKSRVTKAFQDIHTALEQAKGFAGTFRQKTADIKTYLGNDCTQAAVKDATPSFQSAIGSSIVLIAPIDNALVIINALVARVEVKAPPQPAPPAPAQPSKAPAQPQAPPKSPPAK